MTSIIDFQQKQINQLAVPEIFDTNTINESILPARGRLSYDHSVKQLFVGDGTDWVSMKGIQGIPGIEGPIGPVGPQGEPNIAYQEYSAVAIFQGYSEGIFLDPGIGANPTSVLIPSFPAVNITVHAIKIGKLVTVTIPRTLFNGSIGIPPKILATSVLPIQYCPNTGSACAPIICYISDVSQAWLMDSDVSGCIKINSLGYIEIWRRAHFSTGFGNLYSGFDTISISYMTA